MILEDQNQNNVRSIETAPTAQFNEHSDQAIAINIPDSMQPTVTEHETVGAKRARLAKLGLKLGAGVAAATLAVSAMSGGETKEQPVPEVGTYEVQPGETLSGIAEQVAENTPEKETTQEAAETIRDANDLGPAPQLFVEQELDVTTSADVNPDQQGIQLVVPTDQQPAEQGHAG